VGHCDGQGFESHPDFLYIGAAKAGSSWIYEILREHPEVFVPPAKDIQYFDTFFDKGIDWYRSFFRDSGLFKVRGEISHNYYFIPEAADRIWKEIPDIKLICCLREVVDRTISSYMFSLSTEGKRYPGITEYAKSSRMLAQNGYYSCLKRFYDRFPPENILVLFFEDLKSDALSFAREIFYFLGVDSEFIPPSLEKKVLAARDARLNFVAQIIYRLAHVMRRMGLANAVGMVKRNELFNKILYEPRKSRSEIPVETREFIRNLHKKDYPRLAELIGKPLPESWYA